MNNKNPELQRLYKLLSLTTLILGILVIANLLLIPTTILITSFYPTGFHFIGTILACWSTAAFTVMFLIIYIIKHALNFIFRFKQKDGLI